MVGRRSTVQLCYVATWWRGLCWSVLHKQEYTCLPHAWWGGSWGYSVARLPSLHDPRIELHCRSFHSCFRRVHHLLQHQHKALWQIVYKLITAFPHMTRYLYIYINNANVFWDGLNVLQRKKTVKKSKVKKISILTSQHPHPSNMWYSI